MANISSVKNKPEVNAVSEDFFGINTVKIKRPLKICMVTTIAKTFEWFVSDSAKYFASKGFDVTIICSYADKDFIERHSKFARVMEVPMERGVDFSSVLKSTRILTKIFKKEKFDVIQYATPNASLCCTLAGGFRKIPVRVYGQWGMRYVTFSGIQRFIFKSLEKFICSGSTKVFAVSHKNLAYAVSEGLCKRDRIAVIGKGGTIGVDFNIYDIDKKEEFRKETREKYGIAEDTFVFGYTGRLNADKGLNELLGAYRALVHNHKNTKLILVGMHEEKNAPDPELMKWAESSENVIITGNVPPKEVARYMSAFDIMVHPTYREGFSMVMQEAMAMRTPIITTDIPGPSEVIEDGISGVLVPSHNEKALLDQMLSLMADTDRREMYAENARERVEMYFARPLMLSNIYRFYCDLIGIDDNHMKYMYLTSEPEAAALAQKAGVDRIFLDLEVLGKIERQGHLDTVVSHSSLDDVKRLRAVVDKAQLLVRCNPVHPGLKAEIDRIVEDGADIIMLPYFKTVDEVKTFLSYVDGRVPTVLLFETSEAVENVDEILELDGISEVYIGLNDLHLSYKMKFMFELLTDGTVEMLCEKFRAKGIPFGFGGIAKIGEGLLKSEYIIAEHVRLGSTCAILSRTFRNEVNASRPIKNMDKEIKSLRRREYEVATWSREQFIHNRGLVCDSVKEIVKIISARS